MSTTALFDIDAIARADALRRLNSDPIAALVIGCASNGLDNIIAALSGAVAASFVDTFCAHEETPQTVEWFNRLFGAPGARGEIDAKAGEVVTEFYRQQRPETKP